MTGNILVDAIAKTSGNWLNLLKLNFVYFVYRLREELLLRAMLGDVYLNKRRINKFTGPRVVRDTTSRGYTRRFSDC
jgi:hypothetical protein